MNPHGDMSGLADLMGFAAVMAMIMPLTLAWLIGNFIARVMPVTHQSTCRR